MGVGMHGCQVTEPHPCPGGHSNVKGVSGSSKGKIHVIRVVFQDQAMYACTLFRGEKNMQNRKKWCVFGHIDTNFGKDMTGKF